MLPYRIHNEGNSLSDGQPNSLTKNDFSESVVVNVPMNLILVEECTFCCYLIFIALHIRNKKHLRVI